MVSLLALGQHEVELYWPHILVDILRASRSQSKKDNPNGNIQALRLVTKPFLRRSLHHRDVVHPIVLVISHWRCTILLNAKKQVRGPRCAQKFNNCIGIKLMQIWLIEWCDIKFWYHTYSLIPWANIVTFIKIIVRGTCVHYANWYDNKIKFWNKN